MIYLLIVIGASQVLFFIYCNKVLVSVKRRCKAMDSKLNNLNQWVTMANQSFTQRLDTMNGLLFLMQDKHSTSETTAGITSYQETPEAFLINLLTELTQKGMLEKSKHHYYLVLLEQLRFLNKHAEAAPSETLLRSLNGYAAAKTVI